MSVLNKPYELSVWEDVLENGAFVEKKLCIIGSNEMTSQSRALSPKLVTNVNGTTTFTFSIYYQYKDNITGERVNNPFVQYLTNERKLKLKYDGATAHDGWYDLIIKSIKVDSSKWSYDITATDQYINELSKNGFDLTFDADLNNNVGSVQSLAQEALKTTDWNVPNVNTPGAQTRSEFIADRVNENLVVLKVGEDGLTAIKILDEDYKYEPTFSEEIAFSAGTIIYGFYSCCQDQSVRFSFIYDENGYNIDDERIITNKESQYFFFPDSYYEASQGGYRINIPAECVLDPNLEVISSQYRGARYVYSADSRYHPVAKRYVNVYTKTTGQGQEQVTNTYYGFSETEYHAPNLISNWVTNPNSFKSVAGWNTATSYKEAEAYGAKGELLNQALNTNTNTTLINDLKSGTFIPTNEYNACLIYNSPNEHSNASLIVNTGFYDNRTSIKNLENGTNYVFRLKADSLPSGFTARVGVYPYEVEGRYYDLTTGTTFLTASDWVEEDGYYYAYPITCQNANFSPNEYKEQSNGKVMIILSGLPNQLNIYDFEIFEYLTYIDDHNQIQILKPEDQVTSAQIVTTYYLYGTEIDSDLTKTLDDYKPVYKSIINPANKTSGYVLRETCEKRRAITAKESNYFNIVQTICENFTCWAEFNVTHDDSGAISQKQVIFHNYIGENNYAGFRYGVNLKLVARTDDSKQIVTKLIVKQNNNEFGENGFCTIARAPSNETGETFIYNFDYYINQGLLSSTDWNTSIYDLSGAEGPDIPNSSDSPNSNGYYIRLRALNEKINRNNAIIANQTVTLAQAQADITLYSNGLAAASDSFEEAQKNFKELTGYEYNQATQVPSDFLDKNIKYLVACAEAYQATKDYAAKKEEAEDYLAQLQVDYNGIISANNEYISQKEILNKAFYSKFYRYIQEGTWNSEDYYDDELYYLDAVSTLYNSAMPKVSYNISVLELSQLDGYTDFTFKLGDKTFMEDPDLFGYDSSGAPIREEIILTEITYNLDSPEKNSIKVQNYVTSFQDLFKKITATVQSVQYSAGGYERGAELAEATPDKKAEYFETAFTAPTVTLTNLANQTVTFDSRGLIVTDGLEQNKSLRAVGGGIYLTEDGGETWIAGLTATGFSAKVLTTGTLNTNYVNIMCDDEPTFRWDRYGLTAYEFDDSDTFKPILSTGVRFDRMGIYGFNITGDPGEPISVDWHPNAIAEWTISNNKLILCPDDAIHTYIRHHSVFELTKQGFFLTLGENTYSHYLNNQFAPQYLTPYTHTGRISLGYVEDLVYNTWSLNGLPYYDANATQNTKFVKVVSIGSPDSERHLNEQLAIYDDGTLVVNNIKLVGNISWTVAASPSKSVYASTVLSCPADGTPYSSFPDYDDPTIHRWHKIKGVDDRWYAHTDDAGATWEGPYLLNGRGIETENIKYGISNSSTVVPTTWSQTIPDLSGQGGKYLWTGSNFRYTDGSESSWKYGISYIAEDGVNAYALILTNESEAVSCDNNGNIYDSAWSTQCDAYVTYGGVEQSDWTNFSITATNLTVVESTVSNRKRYTISNLTSDSGTLQIVATKTISGSSNPLTVAASFNAYKVYGGEPGATYQLSCDPNDLGCTADSTPKLSSITFAGKYLVAGVEAPCPYASKVTAYKVTSSGRTQLQQWTFNAGVTVTDVLDTLPDLTNAVNLKFNWEVTYNGTTYVSIDQQTVNISKDGAQGPAGQDGQDGHNGANGIHGTSVVETPYYYGTNSWATVSTLVGTQLQSITTGWSQTKPTYSTGTLFILSCIQTTTTTYSSSSDPGVQTYAYSTIELIEVHNGSAINSATLATFYSLTNGGNNDGIYYDNNGQLWIKSSLIDTQELMVRNGSNIVFSASSNENALQIGGLRVKSFSTIDSNLGVFYTPKDWDTNIEEFKTVQAEARTKTYKRMLFYALGTSFYNRATVKPDGRNSITSVADPIDWNNNNYYNKWVDLTSITDDTDYINPNFLMEYPLFKQDNTNTAFGWIFTCIETKEESTIDNITTTTYSYSAPQSWKALNNSNYIHKYILTFNQNEIGIPLGLVYDSELQEYVIITPSTPGSLTWQNYTTHNIRVKQWDGSQWTSGTIDQVANSIEGLTSISNDHFGIVYNFTNNLITSNNFNASIDSGMVTCYFQGCPISAPSYMDTDFKGIITYTLYQKQNGTLVQITNNDDDCNKFQVHAYLLENDDIQSSSASQPYISLYNESSFNTLFINDICLPSNINLNAVQTFNNVGDIAFFKCFGDEDEVELYPSIDGNSAGDVLNGGTPICIGEIFGTWDHGLLDGSYKIEGCIAPSTDDYNWRLSTPEILTTYINIGISYPADYSNSLPVLPTTEHYSGIVPDNTAILLSAESILSQSNDWSQIQINQVIDDWRLIVGPGFGVSAAGRLVSNNGLFSNATVSGRIEADTLITNNIIGNNTGLPAGTYNYTITLRPIIWFTIQSYSAVPSNIEFEYSLSSSTSNLILDSTQRITVYFSYQGYSGEVYSYEIVLPAGTKIDGTVRRTGYPYINYRYPNRTLYYGFTASPSTSEGYVSANQSFYYNGYQGIIVTGDLVPSVSGVYNLGGGGYVWNRVYARSYPGVSDRRLKNNICRLTNDYDKFFDALHPVTYCFKSDISPITHFGFIAQDVEHGLLQYNGIDKKYGIVEHDDKTDWYHLNYQEFTALNTWQIQQLKHRVSELEQRIQELEAKI